MSLLAQWRSRSPRERLVFGAIGLVVFAAIVVAFAWLPLERHRARLTAELPALRASVVEMRAQAGEVKRLKAMPPRADAKNPAPLAQLVSAGTLAQGLPGARLTPVDGRRVRLAVDDASWARLVEWVSAAQSLHGLTAESARVEALAVAGRVKADLVMVAP
jgi:type II secretory pathway component PulM